MLAAFIALPTMFLVYFVGAPKPWRQRLADLMLAAVVLMATALPWVLAYELTPAEHRPYIGGSSQNSMLELMVGHNGIGRFVSRIMPSTTARNEVAGAQPPNTPAQGDPGPGEAAQTRPRGVVPRLFVNAPAGPLRFADGQLLAQIAWLLPLALMALVPGAFQDRFRRPLAPAQLALFFWFCWIVNYAAVYSYAGGIMHFYYLSTMAPALAALAGIGVVSLWGHYRKKGSGAVLLPATLLLTAAWQLHVQADALGWSFHALREPSSDWLGWLHFALIGGTFAAVAGLLPGVFRQTTGKIAGGLARGALGLGLLALLVVPVAWSLSSVLVAGHGVLPSADLYRLDPAVRDADARVRGRFGQSIDTSRLVRFLLASRRGEHYLLATSTTHLAAPIIIQTGEDVMARGGYHGLNPVLTPERFARMVETGRIRFAMLGDVSPLYRRMGADAAGKPIADWIRANGRLVPPKLWRSRGSVGQSGMELYELLPEAGWVPASGG
jgi:4-amino-4-deoxy-L-arabinose transferase-like glycosyltransferase